jgi:putative ABC transport system permease protein
MTTGSRQPLASVFRLALTCFPSGFRSRFGPAMAQAFQDRVRAHRAAHGTVRAYVFGLRAVVNTAANGLAERWTRQTRQPAAHDDAPSRSGAGALGQDIRYAARLIRRRPAFAAAAVLTLAIGTGGSAAIFSLVDAALLRPLPFDEPGQLVNISQTQNGRPTQVSFENLVDLKKESRLMAAITPIQAQSVNLTGVPEPDRLRGGFVTSDFFAVTRVAPAIGRPLSESDDRPGAPAVGVLDYAVWQTRFGGDRGVVGRTITLNNAPVAVIGVMPEGFRFPFDAIEVWLPIRMFTGGLTRGERSLYAVGRLGPGVPAARANAELAAIAGTLAEAYPVANAGRGIAIQPYQRWLTSGIDLPLGLVFGLVLVLLLIAVSNVTSLQLGASLERRSELAMRSALGASRGRIVRQLLVEHGAIALAGGALGVGLAGVIVPWAAAAAPTQLFGLDRAQVDWRVAAFAFAVTAAAGLASGLVPALHWTSRRGNDQLRAVTRVTAERRVTRLRSGLVAAQVALAAVLLAASGLIVRSYAGLLRVDPGFTADRVLTLEYRLPRNKYPSPEAQAAFHDEVVRRVGALPGVETAGVARALPFSGNGSQVTAVTDPSASDSDGRIASMNTVSETYFAAMNIPVLAGRTFTAADQAGTDPVLVVSRAFAEAAWPGHSPLGRAVRFAGMPLRPRVIGVVGDVRHSGLDDGLTRAVYASNRQNPGIFMTLVARTSGDPMALAPTIRRAIWSIDADQPVWKVRTLGSLVDRSLDLERFLIGVMGLFGVSSLVLAVVGLGGVVTQLVGQRSKEIGVRVALGATPSAAGRLVVSVGLVVTAIGLAAGLPLAALVARSMSAILRGTSPADMLVWIMVPLVLGAAAIVACVIPARRAASLDPARILRE